MAYKLEEMLKKYPKDTKIRWVNCEKDRYLIIKNNYLMTDDGEIYELSFIKAYCDGWELYIEEPEPEKNLFENNPFRIDDKIMANVHDWSQRSREHKKMMLKEEPEPEKTLYDELSKVTKGVVFGDFYDRVEKYKSKLEKIPII